jgi:hypothetical protein
MDEALEEILINVTLWAQLAPLAPIIVGGIRYKKLSFAQQFFTVFLLFVGLNQLAATIISDVLLKSNLPLYHLYILIEGVCIFLLYSKRFKDSQWVNKNWIWAIGGYALLVLVNGIFIQGIFVIPNWSRSLESILIIGVSIYYFYFIFKEGKIKYLDRSFWFWVSSGLLIYFSSNLMLFVFTNMLTNRNDQLFLGVWSIHAVLNFVLYGFYTIALLCQDQES